MFEQYSKPVASKKNYYRRIYKNILIAFSILLLSLLIGVLGYHYSSDMSWIDSLHNASMILSGMGLIDVDKVNTNGAKLFSSFYALFSGVVFITNIGILLAPAVHRLLHKLHLPDK